MTVAIAILLPAGTVKAEASGWELVDPPNMQTMYAIDMLDESYGWTGGGAGFVWFYNGGQWLGTGTPFIEPLNAMSVVSRNSAWAVGWKGIIAHYDGTSWQAVAGTPAANNLQDVYMLSDAEGWAVGSGEAGGAILHYTGGAWKAVLSPVSEQLNAIDMISASDGWAVGMYGNVARWSGTGWTGEVMVPGPMSFYGVDMVSADDVWIVGGVGSIYHFDGADLTQVPSPTTKSLRDVKMWDADHGLAVGGDGTILQYSNGTWSLMSSPTTQDLYSLDMVTRNEAWAVGKGGVLLHYMGGTPDLATSSKVVNFKHADLTNRLTYTIEVHNTGTDVASSVTVTDTLSPLLLTLYGTPTTSKGTVVGTSPIVVAVGDLAVGEGATITFQADLVSRELPCWFVSNTAVISAQGVPELARGAVTVVGTCFGVFLPIVVK